MFRFPPRPEKAIPVDLIPVYENMGWIAQIKKNGSCTVVDIDTGGNSTFWNRHEEIHRAWQPTEAIRQYFSEFKDSMFIAELLHNKHRSVKNTLYVFDVIKIIGKDLVGTELTTRLDIVENLPKNGSVIGARSFSTGFVSLFNNLTDEIDEGLVFKNPYAKLKPCFKNGLNANWQVKVRKPTKNYSF